LIAEVMRCCIQVEPMGQSTGGILEKILCKLPRIPRLRLAPAAQQTDKHTDRQSTQNHGERIVPGAFPTAIPSALYTVLRETGNSIGRPACPRIFFRR